MDEMLSVYYTLPVLILGIDLKSAKYRAIKTTLAERKISAIEVFENSKKWRVSTKLLGVLKIVWGWPKSAHSKRLNLYFLNL